MSAIGKKVAVVSLGLSCQTSRQIDGNVPLLRKLTGDEDIDKATLPFDWLISTPHGLIEMIGESDFFPTDHRELRHDQGRLRHRGYDVLYWHESAHLSREGHPAFAAAKGKFDHTSARFQAIAKLERVVGVISDTQGNLPEIEATWDLPLTGNGIEQADAVRGAFEKLLGRPVELIMVSRNDRPDALPANSAFYEMTPIPGGWSGSGREWAKVFTEYFGHA